MLGPEEVHGELGGEVGGGVGVEGDGDEGGVLVEEVVGEEGFAGAGLAGEQEATVFEFARDEAVREEGGDSGGLVGAEGDVVGFVAAVEGAEDAHFVGGGDGAFDVFCLGGGGDLGIGILFVRVNNSFVTSDSLFGELLCGEAGRVSYGDSL